VAESVIQLVTWTWARKRSDEWSCVNHVNRERKGRKDLATSQQEKRWRFLFCILFLF